MPPPPIVKLMVMPWAVFDLMTEFWPVELKSQGWVDRVASCVAMKLPFDATKLPTVLLVSLPVVKRMTTAWPGPRAPFWFLIQLPQGESYAEVLLKPEHCAGHAPELPTCTVVEAIELPPAFAAVAVNVVVLLIVALAVLPLCVV